MLNTGLSVPQSEDHLLVNFLLTGAIISYFYSNRKKEEEEEEEKERENEEKGNSRKSVRWSAVPVAPVLVYVSVMVRV